MKRLTKKSERGVVWFIDRENNDIRLEPCEMDSHNNRLAIEKLAEYEDLEEQGLLLKQVSGIFMLYLIIRICTRAFMMLGKPYS